MPARPQGAARLVHDLGGSLAATSLHLAVALAETTSASGKAHVRAALRAIQRSQQQLMKLGLLFASDRAHLVRSPAREDSAARSTR